MTDAKMPDDSPEMSSPPAAEETGPYPEVVPNLGQSAVHSVKVSETQSEIARYALATDRLTAFI